MANASIIQKAFKQALHKGKLCCTGGEPAESELFGHVSVSPALKDVTGRFEMAKMDDPVDEIGDISPEYR